jgi:hypothetical protein
MIWKSMGTGAALVLAAALGGGSPASADPPDACTAIYRSIRLLDAPTGAYIGWRNLYNPSVSLAQADGCVEARGGSLDYGVRAEVRRQAGDL